MIVPSNDPHFSEYVADHWKTRQWLSGFTGSAGTIVVAKNKAALWTDSRYFIQAEEELAGSGIELQRIAIAGVPTPAEWLKAMLREGETVVVDGTLFSAGMFESLKEDLLPLSLECVADPFTDMWRNRPPLPDKKAFLLEEEYTGELASAKIERLRKQLSITAGKCYPVAALDEIAWLLNIRGTDIDYNPLVVSYAMVESDRVLLFAGKDKFSYGDSETLLRSGIILKNYSDFTAYLDTLQGKEVIVCPSALSVYHVERLKEAGARVAYIGESPVAMMKAVKNKTEIEGFRKAMLYDGVALVRFEMWLEEMLDKGEALTEAQVADQLFEIRSDNPLFAGESFPAIVGYGPNGAIVHYHVDVQHASLIQKKGFLLVDSGGQYFCGTTDITRTYHLSEPAPHEKADYTAVLKGMIDLSLAVFPDNTRGTQLDILARRYLLRQRTNYLHGTGHGVGCFLNVHEGPQSIRMNENPVTFRPGMVTSNEPGLYRAGKYGIRIENLLLCREDQTTEFGKFMSFETLTLCPIDTKAIDIQQLNVEQREWLNRYHAGVYEKLSPFLTGEEQRWLKKKTAGLMDDERVNNVRSTNL